MSQNRDCPAVLITGAGTGLGRALALGLAKDGFAVAVHYRHSRAGAESAAAEICEAGGFARAYGADLATQAGAEDVARRIMDDFGKLDALINNAGSYQETPGLNLTEQQWFEGLNSTATQTFFTSRAMLPMLRNSRLRRMVNIGDSSCDRPGARDLAWSYHIGKTGVWMLTRSLAAEEARHGLAVNLVSPGFLENSVGPLPPDLPTGHPCTFDDVLSAVRFLLRDAPPSLSGSNLMVGGGWNLR
jgi:3-oxoacyl-[acyl-carrier protein] reductase